MTPRFSYRTEQCSNSSKILIRAKTRTRTYDTRTSFLYQVSRTRNLDRLSSALHPKLIPVLHFYQKLLRKLCQYRLLLTRVSWDFDKTGKELLAHDWFVASADDRQKHRSMASCSKQLASATDGNGDDSTQSVELQFAQLSDKPQPSDIQAGAADCIKWVASKPLKSFHSSLSTLLVDNLCWCRTHPDSAAILDILVATLFCRKRRKFVKDKLYQTEKHVYCVTVLLLRLTKYTRESTTAAELLYYSLIN